LLSSTGALAAGFNGDGFGARGFFQYGTPTATTSYVGVGDVVSGFTSYYGLRAYDAALALANTPLISVTLPASSPANATCDILAASNGGLGVTSSCTTGGTNGVAAATECASLGPCTVAKIYDQISGLNMIESTLSRQATLVFSGLGSLPILQATGSATQYYGATWAVAPQPFNITMVVNRTPTSGSNMGAWGSVGTVAIGFNAANTAFIYAGTTVSISATPDAAFHAFQSSFNGGSSVFNIDGTEHSVSPGPNGISATTSANQIFAIGNGSQLMTGQWGELGYSTNGGIVTWTSTQRGLICHNQYTYWGTSVSC